MGGPTMHRLLASVLLGALLSAPVAQASAQAPPSVTLRLGAQTPWVSPEQPTLALRFSATNAGTAPARDLSIGVVVFSRVTTRTAYERSLLQDPSPAIVIDAETLEREGQIAPSQTRVFELSLPFTFPGIDTTQSGIYPVKIELRSGDVPLATLRTPAIVLVRRPETPMQLAWTFVLDQPIGFGPDGVFASPALEDSLTQGGRLAGQIRALLTLVEDRRQPEVDVVISPMLLTQLGRMRAGYTVLDEGTERTVKAGTDGSALAATALTELRHIASAHNVELSALPFSAPELPALLSGGLSRDFAVQLDRGRQVVQAFLGAAPEPSVLRPPDGAVDQQTIERLAARGVTVVLLDPGAVQQTPDPRGFALPAAESVGPPVAPISAVLPDQAAAALLEQPSVTADPVLAAQALLGELAAIWQERPGLSRGIALGFTEATTVPGGFFTPLARGVASAPWLHPVRASDLPAGVPPIAGPLPLTAPSLARFGPYYVDALRQARRRVDTLRTMLVGDTDTPARMDTALLLAESGAFLTNPTPGLAFIDAVRNETVAVSNAVHVDTGQPVTLTSRTGSRIPLRVTNEDDRSLRVTIRLVSLHLVASPSTTVVLDPGSTRTLTFPVDLRTNGRFEVEVQIESPSGRPIRSFNIIVRSTAFNRIALVITTAAALMLLILWARRFVPRRT